MIRSRAGGHAIGAIVILGLLMGCDGPSAPPVTALKRSDIVSAPVSVEWHSDDGALPGRLPEGQRTVITVPKGYRALKVSMHPTHRVGNITAPTIDGGMINAVAGVVIIDVEPRATPASPIPNIPVSVPTQTLSTRKFQDGWASSTRLGQVLQQAISNGKLAYVLKASQKRHVPASVALIPIVESQYHTEATSRKGAAGAWQLMPSVALDYGITAQQRYHFKTSTQVALHLLQDLHHHFNNWELTFAAYNAGGARVTQALLRYPQAHTLADLHLPRETQRYVARLNRINTQLMEGE